MERAALYLRVSTLNGQTTENQEIALREVADRKGWQIVAVFRDEGISGIKGRDKRPGFDALMKSAARHDFDCVMAWDVSRLGRSLRHLLEFFEELQALKIDLFLHQQGLDSSTPTGIAMFQMAGVFSQWERAIIRERISASMQRIRLTGKTRSGNPLGRPKISVAKENAILESLKSGHGVDKTSKLVGVGVGTVMRIKRAHISELPQRNNTKRRTKRQKAA